MRGKQVWVRADTGSWDDVKPLVTTSLESGVDCLLVDEKNIEQVRELGKIELAVFTQDADKEHDADILLAYKGGEGDGSKPVPDDLSASADLELVRKLSSCKDKGIGAYVEITSKKHEQLAIALARSCDYIVVVGKDWKIIPLENIIAELQKLDVSIIAGVKDAEEAKVALETLEHGADGVLLDTGDPSEIKKVSNMLSSGEFTLPVTSARITSVKPVGMGDRVCVDTCSLMSVGEGMLVGSQSNALFLIHSESEESPYVASRPFRVNAGAVHAYTLTGEKTRYLSEIKAGDEVLIVAKDGGARSAVVGRLKIEKRPLMLVDAETEDGRKISTLLQNAETVKLVCKDGTPISVVKLKEGDEVMVHLEDAGRHFGTKIDESIIEK